MADLSLEALTTPLPGEDPCGPDLDLAGDPEYTIFMASADGLMPARFFCEDGRPFDRTKTSVDAASQYKVVAGLAERTHDLRLLVLLAKLRILFDRNLDGFATALEAIATLLEREWEGVHPRGDDGDYALRSFVVQTLDDRVPVVMPLSYAPLLEHRTAGPLTFRKFLVAEGEEQPREDEDAIDLVLVKRDLEEKRLPPPVERRDQLEAIGASLKRIEAAFDAHVGHARGVEFAKLMPVVDKIRAMLEELVVLGDPTQGKASPEEAEEAAESEVGEGGESRVAVGDIASLADARAALEAIAAYYERREPSNPALLLVRQAVQLVGRSFVDALRVLVPQLVDEVKVQIGKAQVFDLPIERLSEFSSVDGADTTVEPATFEVTSRDSALQLLKKVGAFYHAEEPSSPVPYLVERARELAGRDFLGLLREMLPADTLRNREGR